MCHTKKELDQLGPQKSAIQSAHKPAFGHDAGGQVESAIIEAEPFLKGQLKVQQDSDAASMDSDAAADFRV